MLLSTYSRNKLPSHPYSIVMLLSRSRDCRFVFRLKFMSLCAAGFVCLRWLAAHAFCRATYAMQLFQQKEYRKREELDTKKLVELDGLEPTASCVQSRRSPR